MGQDIRQLVLIFLAAGEGRRFGGRKLLAPLRGRPLAHHAAETFGGLPFRARIAVGAPDLRLDAFGFDLAQPITRGAPLSASIAIGLGAARRHDPAAVMIALADMPFVPADHILRLAEAFDGDRIASASGKTTSPPAIIGAGWFDRLGALDGDLGARALLDGAPVIRADAHALIDIDTPEQLRAADCAAPKAGR